MGDSALWVKVLYVVAGSWGMGCSGRCIVGSSGVCGSGFMGNGLWTVYCW